MRSRDIGCQSGPLPGPPTVAQVDSDKGDMERSLALLGGNLADA
jgi:hypothetical protein